MTIENTHNLHSRVARRGLVLHETLAALLIVMAVVAGATQLLRLVTKQRYRASQRAFAVLEASNLMEDLASRSWSGLTVDTPKLELSPAGKSRLPNAAANVTVVPDENESTLRRITVSIDWDLSENQRSQPVHLISWRSQPAETMP